MNIRFIFIITFIVFFIFINPANGFKILKSGENVNADTIINDDIYIFSDDIMINGKVEGDVIAVGKSVKISGNITGDVMAFAGTVIINGTIGDDLRVGTDTLIVKGNIGDDILVGARNTTVSFEANIGRDLIFISSQIEFNGNVGRNFSGLCDNATLAGLINDNVNIYVDNIKILPSTQINGSLRYSSPKETFIQPNIVKKDITFIKKEKNERIEEILSIFWWLINYGFLLMIGLFVLELAPNWTDSIAQNILNSFKNNLITGLLVLSGGILFPILLSVILIGIPLGLILFFLTIILLYAIRLFFGFWLGKVILTWLKVKSRPRIEMMLGIFVLCIFTSLPWIGFWIYLLVTIVSTGGLYRVFMSFYIEMKEKN